MISYDWIDTVIVTFTKRKKKGVGLCMTELDTSDKFASFYETDELIYFRIHSG